MKRTKRTLITSDTHYGHNSIIRFCGRPFTNTDEMDEHMINCHNAVVEDGDDVIHLGDFSWHKQEKSREILSRLKGNIHLIRGNHDRSWVDDIGFASVSTYKEMSFDGNKVVFFHYPILDWNGRYHGSYHLYGHSHGTVQTPNTRSMEVGVDTIGYYPIDIFTIINRLSTNPVPASNKSDQDRE